MNHADFVHRIPALAPLLESADHVDVKSATGPVSLRAFVAAVFSYQPGWVTFLLGVRWAFVRLLRLDQDGIPHSPRATADDVPLTPGETFDFLTVKLAEDDHYWVGEFVDKHLTGTVVALAEPASPGGERRYLLMTIVHYNNWAGPIYFNVIRPFHHLVVQRAVHVAVKPAPPA
jgi:hypothetical protein